MFLKIFYQAFLSIIFECFYGMLFLYMLEITWSEKMKKNSIFKLPDLNYQWKCITKDGATKRWMYQTDLIIKNLNPYELQNKMNYVIQVGYETKKRLYKGLK